MESKRTKVIPRIMDSLNRACIMPVFGKVMGALKSLRGAERYQITGQNWKTGQLENFNTNPEVPLFLKRQYNYQTGKPERVKD